MDKQNKWEKVRLGDLVSIKKGNKIEQIKENLSNSERYLSTEDLDNDDKIKYCIPNFEKNIFANEKDVIIAWDGSVGKLNWGKKGIIGSTLARLSILEKNSTEIFPKYFGYYLKYNTQYLINTSTGATIKHINRKALESMTIPLPPLSIQKEIANKLDKVSEIIEKRKLQIKKMDEFLQGTFIEMFGDPMSNKNWKDYKIEELAEKRKNSMRTGPFGSNLLHSEFVDSGIAVLGIDNAVDNKFKWKERRFITPKKYEQLKNYTVFPNDIIITIMGTCGRIAVVPEDIPLAINTKHLACISFDKKLVNPNFMSKAFQYDIQLVKQLKARAKGAIMDGLNLGIIKNLSIILPPLQLQNQFAKIVEKVEIEKEKLEKSLLEMEALFRSLMDESFN